MRVAASAALCLSVLAGGAPAPAAQRWLRVRTAHFELLSDASSDRAFETAVRLERFRDMIRAAFPAAVEDPPRTVLAFRGRDELEPFLPVRKGRTIAADGFFAGGPAGGTIVASLESEGRETAAHEYAHAFLADVLPAQPAWVAEGLAELYANAQEDGDVARVGRPHASHVQLLRQAGPLPLRDLLAVDYGSDLYNEGDTRGRFYATAWLFAHWLMVGHPSTGPAQLGAYLARVAGGAPPETAFAETWGDAATLDASLPAYVAEALPALEVALPTRGSSDVAIESAPEAAVASAEGVLLLDTQRSKQAEGYLRRALEADPAFVPAHDALARLCLEAGRLAEARTHVTAVAAAEPSRPRSLYVEARALVREGAARDGGLSEAETTRATALLQQALDVDPGFAEACALLVHLRPQPIGDSLARLARARAAHPGDVELGLEEANLYLLTSDLPRAEAALRRARAETHDDATRFIAGHMLERVAEAARGTAEVAGTLVSLECAKAGALVFVVATAQARLRLAAPTANAFFLYDPRGEPISRMLVCGAQSARVRARYRRTGGAAGADGILLSATLG